MHVDTRQIGRHLGHGMIRRFASLLLSTALALATVVAGPCAARASCAMAQVRHMDCCAAKNGIGVPRCCEGRSQLSRSAAPAAAERSIQSPVQSTSPLVQSVAAVAPETNRVDTPQRVDSRAAPPGGPLIAQRTSLLL